MIAHIASTWCLTSAHLACRVWKFLLFEGHLYRAFIKAMLFVFAWPLSDTRVKRKLSALWFSSLLYACFFVYFPCFCQGSGKGSGGPPGLQIRCAGRVSRQVGSIPMHFRHVFIPLFWFAYKGIFLFVFSRFER